MLNTTREIPIKIEAIKYFTTEDFHKTFILLVTAKNKRPKWIPESIMKTIMMISILRLSKPATLEFFVEKPPVATVANEWLMASKRFIPANNKHIVSRTVKPM